MKWNVEEGNQVACSGALGNEMEWCCGKRRGVEGSESKWSAGKWRGVEENEMDWSGGK